MVPTLKAEDVWKGGLEQEAEPHGEGAIPRLLEGVRGGVLLGAVGGDRETLSSFWCPSQECWESA